MRLFIFLLCVASLQAQSSNAPKNELKYGDFGQPVTFDPVTATKPVERRLCQFVFDSLVVQRREGDFAFSLARDLQISPDGLSYTFLLPENLKWSDGSFLTSSDIRFTLELLLTSTKNTALARYLDEVICIAPQAITITLKRPFYSPLALFTFKILPRHKFETNSITPSHPFAQAPLGCGPFQHDLPNRSSNIYPLLRNPHFAYREGPYLEKVVLKIYDDRKRALKDLLKKKIHLLTEVSPSDIPELEKKPEQFALQRYSTQTIHFIAFNHRPDHPYYPLFNDYRFRRALIYAIDRQKILKRFHAAFGGEGGQAHAVISGPFPYSSWACNDKIQPYPYDSDEAGHLLEKVLHERGYSLEQGLWQHPERGPLGFTLKYIKGDEIESACADIVAFWNKAGIQVALAGEGEQSFYEQVFLEHKFDLVYSTYTLDNTVDVFPLFDSARTGRGESNFTEYVDPKLQELFSQLHSTLDPWVLRSVSHKIHQTVHDDAVYIFLWQLDLYAAYHRSLKNVEIFNFPEKWDISQEK